MIVETKKRVRIKIPPVPDTLETEDGGNIPLEMLEPHEVRKVIKAWTAKMYEAYDCYRNWPPHVLKYFRCKFPNGSPPLHIPAPPPPKKT